MRISTIVFTLLCVSAFFVFVALRLINLTDAGLGGNDTILYYSLAEHWLAGERVYQIGNSMLVFRPVLLAFNALALELFGHTDYAIKVANALLDSLNILLVATLAWAISKRFSVVLVSAIIYAMLPMAIWAARLELPHTLSTFLCLLSYISIYFAATSTVKWRRSGSALLGGVFLAAAALTHEELLFIAAPTALFLFARVARAMNVQQGLQCFLTFLLFPIASAALILWNEPHAVSSLGSAATATSEFYPKVLARYSWSGLIGSSSSVFLLAVAAAVVYWAISNWRLRLPEALWDRDINYWSGFCLLVPLSYFALSAIFFSAFFPRLFLPLMPLVILFVAMASFRLLAQGNSLLAIGSLTLLTTFLTTSNIAGFSSFNVANRNFSKSWASFEWPNSKNFESGYKELQIAASHRHHYMGHWRAVYQKFEKYVDENNRILIVPSTVPYSPGRRALQTSVYFGDNVVYRIDHSDVPIEQLVADMNIRIIYYTVGQLRSPPAQLARYQYNGTWSDTSAINLTETYQLSPYSEKAELQQLTPFLLKAGARQTRPFPPNSYETAKSSTFLLP